MTETKNKNKEIFHPLTHYPEVYNNQDWARSLELYLISTWEPALLSPPMHISRKLD